jgi:hypothetical protein
VVVTEIVNGIVDEPFMPIDEGDGVQVAPLGTPVQLIETFPLNPPLPTSSIARTVDCPATTLVLPESPDAMPNEKSGLGALCVIARGRPATVTVAFRDWLSSDATWKTSVPLLTPVAPETIVIQPGTSDTVNGQPSCPFISTEPEPPVAVKVMDD